MFLTSRQTTFSEHANAFSSRHKVSATADRAPGSLETSRETLILTPATIRLLSAPSTLRTLWSLTLSGCPTLLPNLLTPLAALAGLGLLDISTTQTDFRTLHQTLRHTRVLHLVCTACPKLRTAEGGPERRGFAIVALPTVWMLDGVFVTWDERRKWRPPSLTTTVATTTATVKQGAAVAAVFEHTPEVRARFRDLCDRELVGGGEAGKDTPAFMSSREKKAVAEGAGRTVIWTPRARAALEDFPMDFEMGVEEDVARLRVLARDLERTAQAAPNFIERVSNPNIIDGAIEAIVGGDDTFVDSRPPAPGERAAATHGAGSRIVMALLLLGTFSPEFGEGDGALQRTLESVFIDRWDAAARAAGAVDHWARAPASPLRWRVADRLRCLALCVGRLMLDTISETSMQTTPPLVSCAKTQAFATLQHRLLAASLTARRNSLHARSYEPDPADLAHIARVNLTPAQITQLALLHLDIVQLLCLDDQVATAFCANLPTLCIALQAAAEVLLPKGHTLQPEVADIAREGDPREVQSINQRMSMDARALQMKFRICAVIEETVRWVNETQEKEQSPARRSAGASMNSYIAVVPHGPALLDLS
ncbi:hypothetical protein HDU87_005649 [Geranomyces variabilis]|uniref:Uncharacterized protein n=1 Tax=Geranomyces variabilis TaxID=109894 RepID=A0AAD5XL03_9FUNG|nr:hypothetical protein HDU87_005649 [Geranomyces variabilis]